MLLLILFYFDCLEYFWESKLLQTKSGDRCAIFGCNNDHRFPEMYAIKDHTGFFG